MVPSRQEPREMSMSFQFVLQERIGKELKSVMLSTMNCEQGTQDS